MARSVDRRTFLIGSGAAVAGAALAACTSPGTKATTTAAAASTDAATSGAGATTTAAVTTTAAATDAPVSKIVFLTNNGDTLAPTIAKMWNDAKNPFQVELRRTDAASYGDAFPRLATASDAPNIAGYFVDGGHYTDLAKAGALLEVQELWDKAGLTDNVPALIKAKYHSFTPDGKVYGAPNNTSRYGIVFYRKSVLAKAGVTPPANHEWKDEAEFNAACDKLKATGIAPITIGGKDGYPISHLQDGLMSSTMAPELVGDPLKIDYTSDGWKKPLAKLLEWNQKGYFIKGFLGRGTDQSNQLFGQGKAGFSTGMNVWIKLVTDAGTPLDDLDWCLLPPIGSLPVKLSVYAGGGVVIPKIAGAHAEALVFGEYLCSKEQALVAAKENGVIPARSDVEGLEAALGPIAGSMYTRANEPGRAQFGWDDPAPTDMITYDRTNLQAILAGTLAINDFCTKLESLKKGHL